MGARTAGIAREGKIPRFWCISTVDGLRKQDPEGVRWTIEFLLPRPVSVTFHSGWHPLIPPKSKMNAFPLLLSILQDPPPRWSFLEFEKVLPSRYFLVF